MPGKYFCIVMLLLFFSCGHDAGVSGSAVPAAINDQGNIPDSSVVSKIPLPDHYQLCRRDSGSFAEYLANIPLKKDHTVYLYNGEKKTNQSAQYAVLDISTGEQDLQQCADAVMRLRAEYLFSQKAFDSISFKDNEGKTYPFNLPYTRGHFEKYLITVFGMCGSASLAKQLKPVDMTDMKTGDVLIRGGFPGHAVSVMAMAEYKGKKIYLLSQSYMPAQDIHILRNPNNEALSPWYELNDGEDIITPEYIFRKNELKRW